MKRTITLILLLFAMATLQYCTDESESAAPEKIQFTCTFTEAELDAGRANITEIPAVLQLSVTNTVGHPVFTNRRIPLIRTGDTFMTEPLELTPSSYLITEFMLLSESGNTIYATPFQDSQLGKAVNTPLPHPFAVSKNKVSNITMQVIDLEARLPQDLGYAAFPIITVNPLEISVFIPKNNGIVLASAKAFIVEGDDTVKRYNLGAIINLISFPGEPQVTRKLIVTRAGYNTVEKEFAYDSLVQALQGLPLKIMLVPSIFTLTPYLQGIAGLHYEMGIGGMPGNVTIDWGDGTTEILDLDPEPTNLTHDYTSVGDFKIKVTGDLDKITEVYQFYGIGETEAINLQGLTELKTFRFGWTPRGPVIVDLSHNAKLETILMPNIPHLEEVILADDNVVNYLEITGPNAMSTANVDALINQLHQGVVSNNTIPGSFQAREHYLPGDGRTRMVGPPSPAAVAKLRELRDTYHWGISPDPL